MVFHDNCSRIVGLHFFHTYLITEICELLGVNKINTTAYHPQTNGLTERFDRTLTAMLAKKIEQIGRDWDSHLPFFSFCL